MVKQSTDSFSEKICERGIVKNYNKLSDVVGQSYCRKERYRDRNSEE